MKRVLVPLVVVMAVVAALSMDRRAASQRPRQAASSRPSPSAAAREDAPPLLGEDGALATLPRDAEPPGALRLEGLVLDDSDQPVGNAMVLLDSVPRRELHTEADGSFAFIDLRPRVYRVEVRKDDAMAGPIRVRVSPDVEPVTIRLRAAGTLAFTVIDVETQHPVSGASVEVRALGTRTVTTGDDGRAQFRGVGGGVLIARATAAGYAPLWRSIDVTAGAGATQAHTLMLERGAAAAGIVIDETGRPVAGARVMALDAAVLVRLADPLQDAVISDAAGRWVVPAVATGTYRFAASHTDHAPGASGPVEIDGNAQRGDITIQLMAGGSIAGRVVDRAGAGIGATAVRVEAVDTGYLIDTLRQASADDAGHFRLSGLPRAALRIVAVHDTAASEAVVVQLSGRAEITDLVITLEADLVISGVVVSPAGEPVAEAQLDARALPDERGDRPPWRLRGAISAIADQAGHFELRGLRPGRYAVAALRSEGAADEGLAAMRPMVIVDAGTRDLAIVLDGTGALRGRLRLGDDGAAPTAFTVKVGRARPAPALGGDGTFLSRGLYAGTFTVEVDGPGFVRKVIPNVVIASDRETDLGTIRLERGRTLRGRVVRDDGQPIGGATVLAGPRILAEGGRLDAPALGDVLKLRQTRSADDGSFALDGVGSGALVVAAEHPTRGRSAFTRVAAGMSNVELELALLTTGSLEGTITRDGVPAAGTPVLAAGSDDPRAAAAGSAAVTSAADGAYLFTALAPGRYSVIALLGRDGASTARRAWIVVKPGARVRLDIDIPAGGVTVMVRATRADGTVPDATQVLMTPVATPDGRPTSFHVGVIAAGQALTLAGVAPGNYTLCGIVPERMEQPFDDGDPAGAGCREAVVAGEPAVQEFVVEVAP